jgi:DNA-binding MarR family transcriptional regulator
MADRFMMLIQQLLRTHPKLVFPDERLGQMQRELERLRQTSRGNPEDRMFLFRILFALRNNDNPPTMSELSTELGIPMSSATRMADGLVRAKFVERKPDARDRRVVRLCITENGRRVVEAAKQFMKQRVTKLLAFFSLDEQAQLLRLLSKLIESLQAEQVVSAEAGGAGKTARGKSGRQHA